MAASFWHVVGASLQPFLRIVDKAKITGKVKSRRAVLPVAPVPVEASSLQEVDAYLHRLESQKDHWVQLDTQHRAQLLTECLRNTMALAEQFARTGTAAKGSYEGGLGDEMATVLPVITGILEYREVMMAGGCVPPEKLSRRPDGQWVAKVWPKHMIPAFFPRFIGEVWIEPGKEPTQGALYRNKRKSAGQDSTGRVALVLGAGNQLPVVALDILHMLFAEDQVVLVKMNPVNDYYGPLLRKAFLPFVSRGFLEFVYGGTDVGSYCTQHPLVSSVHLTGSETTYNNIMFGLPQPNGPPRLTKHVTAELGNVTPYIVVPGPWSEADIEYHATSLVSGLAQNAGHNCIAAEIIITDESWPQRGAFMDAVARVMDNLQCRAPWYPGSAQRLAGFRKRFPNAKSLGRPVPEAGQPAGHIKAEPFLLVTGLSPAEAQTRHENWGAVLQEVAMPNCNSPAHFLSKAVEYANDHCWGTLSISMFIHPSTQKQYAAAYDHALASLRYGTVSVNCPALVAFSATPLIWGACPGHTPEDIGSGVGFVHNTYLFDHPQKSVLKAPWTYSPQPIWSVGQIGMGAALPWAFKFMAAQSNPAKALVYLMIVAFLALRGSWQVAKKGAADV